MFQELKKNFAHPSNRYGPAPFWFLNGDLDRQELKWQVNEMKEKGLSGYVMHSRYGRRIPYMSDEFFDRIGCIVEESEKIGMNPIIYDEDDWPSGMSGTKVLDLHPEYKHKQLCIARIRMKKDEKVRKTFPKGAVHRAFVCRIVKDDADLAKVQVTDVTDVTCLAKGCKFRYENTEGYDLLVIFNFESASGYIMKTTFPRMKGFEPALQEWSWYFPLGEYVDILNPDAVRCFLETTAEEYLERWSDKFGKTLQFFYTDEPGLYTTMRGDDTAIPWSDIYEETFQKEFGYNISDELISLAVGAGEKSGKIRHDFWRHLTDLFQKNFFDQYSQWCRDHGMKLTGHLRLCYPQLVWQRNYAGDAMDLFKAMDVPGVDRLDTPSVCKRLGTEDWQWQVEDKAASSIGHQYGKERRMTESFAVGGWDYRFADMKRVSDWQYMMGMNLLVPHAFHYSLSAQRKHECPPSFFYQNPLWQRYRHYAEYLSRLGEMMIGGRNIAEIAVLYPMTTIWADDVPEADVQDVINNIDRDFAYVTDLLLRRQMDYDILNENHLGDCTVSGKTIAIGEAVYQLLVVPPMITIKAETEAFIKDYVEKGGKVLFLSLVPWKNLEGKRLDYLAELFDTSFGRDITKGGSEYLETKVSVISEKSRNGRIGFVYGGVMKDNLPGDAVADMIASMLDLDVRMKTEAGANLYYNHHVKENLDIYFIHNSDEIGHHADISLRALGKPYLFLPEKGEIKELPFYRQKDGRTELSNYYLEPLASMFLVLEGDGVHAGAWEESNLKMFAADKGYVPAYEASGYTVIEGKRREYANTMKERTLQDTWTRKLRDPNVLILDHWNMAQDEASEEGYTAQSFGDSGRSCIKYTAEFLVEDPSIELHLVVDRISEIVYDGQQMPIEILVNGTVMKEFRHSEFLDHEMSEADISSLIVKGINSVVMIYEHKLYGFEGKTGINKIGMLWDPAYIVGDFSLKKEAGCPNTYAIVSQEKTIRTGSWAPQGLVNYNGAVEYSQTFTLSPEEVSGKRILLDAGDVRECLDVTVNGKRAESRVWLPYTADITDYVKEGENEIALEVRCTPKNLMNKSMTPYGLLETVKLQICDEITL